MKSCYSNFRHRCGFLILFFYVFILPLHWQSTHLPSCTTHPQTSYAQSNMDTWLVRTCQLKMQSFIFLKVNCLYKYPWTLFSSCLPDLLASTFKASGVWLILTTFWCLQKHFTRTIPYMKGRKKEREEGNRIKFRRTVKMSNSQSDIWMMGNMH